MDTTGYQFFEDHGKVAATLIRNRLLSDSTVLSSGSILLLRNFPTWCRKQSLPAGPSGSS